ncbi:transmembrane protein 260 isoform X2 [Patella vulgata]|uniref:transmembrane protein 260 isoform X2 n=1 Tax=Patella vulgata TaxID=6465 RepID=UPI00217F9681|nr:transmembrane protein 260 isoform X2 [Patella vulgata]
MSHNGEMEENQIKLTGVIYSGVIFSIYYKTTYPNLPGGDSGELIISANELGVAHPPGYPVFTLLSYIFIKLIPYGSMAWRVNTLSVCLSTITSFCLFITLSRLCKNISSCLLGGSLFCFMSLSWTWNITSEVFSLNNLFVSVLVLLCVLFQHKEKQQKIQISFIGAFISGLSLCNQHTIVIYVLCIAVWVIYTLYKQKIIHKWVIFLLTLCLCFCCGLIPYVYLPLSAHFNMARWTWGDQRTLSGFLRHILRREYGTFELLKDHQGLGLLKGLSAYNNHILYEWGVIGLGASYLCIISVIRRLRQGKYCLCVLYIMMVSYLLLFTWLANLDISNPLLFGVVKRFWIQVDLVLAILVAVLFDDLVSVVKQHGMWNGYIELLKVDTIIAGLITYSLLLVNYQHCDHSKNTVIIDFATRILNSLPYNAIVLTKGDLPSNSIRYAQFMENIRPDVTTFDQEVLTYEWSLPMLKHHYPDMIFPGDLLYTTSGILADGRQTFNFKTLLDSNYNRPIYACIGVQNHDSSWIEAYELWPYGVCSKFVRKGSSLDIEEYVTETNRFIMDWPYPYNRFDKTSWEHVATQEMWDAKSSVGLLFLEKAEEYDDANIKLLLLQYSYDIYHRAMDANEVFPVHWHKNLALVCEKLSRLNQHSHKQLITESIQQFQHYIRLDQSDKDFERIIDAIKSLTKYLETIR